MARVGVLVASALLVLAAAVAGERILGRIDPVPGDMCGVSVIPFEDERLFVFALAEDSVVWYKNQRPEGGWTNWKPLANRQKMTSGPKPVRYANGTIQVFARGIDRLFYMTTLHTANQTWSWSDWASPFPSHEFASGPAPIVTPSGGCQLYGISTLTHSVWYSESTPLVGSHEQVFSEWADLGANATSPPTVLVDAEALMHVFVRGKNRGLLHLAEHYDQANGPKAWGEWENLGGVLASSPHVPITLNGANFVEVYARAADKALWHRAQGSTQFADDTTWSPWTSLGGILSSGPAVALNDDGMGDVFVRATDKALYYKSQAEDANGEVGFSQWQALGGLFTSSPTVVVRADGVIDVFARGVDKGVWHAHQIAVNGTRAFSSWQSLGGHTRKFAC